MNEMRHIISEEWARAVEEFHLIPGSVTEKVVARIISRLDEYGSERERCAKLIESFTTAEILLHAGEMTSQELRTVRAVQKWWASAIRSQK